MTEPKTQTLNVPGAVLTYDVRSNPSSQEPVLMLIGSPMGAGGFTTLAGHFADRTVVTYDPRGADRSRKSDDTAESTPEQHADDVHAVISELGAGPVDLFARSGGANNALALVARHPEDVRTLVAHEPPATALLPDRDAALAAARDIHDTYMQRGFGAAMAKFIMLATLKGPVPADFASRPADPAMFGLPAQDDGSRNNPLLGQNMVTGSRFEPDFDALRRASTRIIVAAGADSDGELAHRGAIAVAERLGTEPVTFPGGHNGFLGGEYGQRGEPDAFAAKLREVLATATEPSRATSSARA
jgi:pimeloyl-ACP methyl ester carboxylesterase